MIKIHNYHMTLFVFHNSFFLKFLKSNFPFSFYFIYKKQAAGFDLKENLDMWRNLPYSMYYPYDNSGLTGYPFANG